MDWQQKAEALDALAEITLKIRRAGDWYVSQNVDIKDECVLRGAFGNGETPEAAIEDHWRQLVTDVPRGMYLIARPIHGQRRAVLWNGFMWADYPEPNRTQAALTQAFGN